MKVRRITEEEGKRVNISRFPNFHKSGSIRGMKKTVLQRCRAAGALWKLYI